MKYAYIGGQMNISHRIPAYLINYPSIYDIAIEKNFENHTHIPLRISDIEIRRNLMGIFCILKVVEKINHPFHNEKRCL